MNSAAQYRRCAEEAQRVADTSPLLQRRRIALAAAEQWRRLAEQAERMEMRQKTTLAGYRHTQL